ncbi:MULTISPECIES: hypothetical protein [Klebsiella/Raoultella group]|uniref:hypothetical protein n=1 Tax=Klebsiella/Raoultella group TaxID=2890311 RepID=UPI00141C3852|nr:MULTISPECIES: hypothetical protein [Klebsiella/Raoultella group]MDV1101424.1 hypothetical protein [Raoultella ornithinolytica]CAB1217828.1 hypothetical protein SFB9_2644 [Klebsiella michiganensis]
MSNFEEICAAHKEFQSKSYAYKVSCTNFASGLGDKYIQYLGITKANYRWVPASDDATEKEDFSILDVMHFDDDTYWHMGLKIKLFTAHDTFPQQELLIIFKFKPKPKEKNVFEVMVDGDSKQHDIETWSEASYTVFFNCLQKIILDQYSKDNYLASLQGIRKIGVI